MKVPPGRLLLILIMLWLPTMDAVSAFSPHCAYQSVAGHGLNANISSITNNGLHDVDHQLSIGSRMASDQPCEVNLLCHASCSTQISVTHSTYIPANNASVHQPGNINATSFIPDLPQHPPSHLTQRRATRETYR